MPNFRLIIEYDGSAYHGWQRQINASTIQGSVEDALKRMTGRPVTLIGAGRTDAGVHAIGQVANFSVATDLTADIFTRGLNSLLPADIAIKGCEVVDDKFHARYNAESKVYEYRILNRTTRAAILRQYAWHIRKPLDTDAMRAALPCLKGEHDFSAFEGAGSPRSHSVRNVIDLNLSRRDEDGYMVLSIEANGFLRHMVRNIVGTLVEVGLGKTSLETFEGVLMSKDRSQAGATAPAHGLFLREVRYPPSF